jgi:hypothetical protein
MGQCDWGISKYNYNNLGYENPLFSSKFMKSKYRSNTSEENLAFKLMCYKNKIHTGFQRLMKKRKCKMFNNLKNIDYILE